MKSQNKEISLVAFELGHLSARAISGGDILLEKMYPYITGLNLTIVVPKIGSHHWESYKEVRLITLSPNLFDKSLSQISVFLSYVMRVYQAFILVRNDDTDIAYSSTNIFPDVMAGFLYKLTRPHNFWIARVHHLISSPTSRPGNIITNYFSYILQELTLIFIRKADLVLILNSNLKKDLIKKGFDNKKIQTLGAGIDVDAIRKTKHQQKIYDGIFVGRVHSTKGVVELISIWERLIRKIPNAKLVIVGEAREPMISNLNKIIKDRNIRENITITGYLPEKELFKTLRQSKIFVLTDTEAGFSIAAAQAMAAGLPVVAIELPFLKTIYHQGYQTVKLGKLQDFADTLANLLNDKAKYKIMSKQATSQARELDWSKVAADFSKIISR